MRRLKAIGYCLKYGLLPWWCYETECHYRPWSYWQHLWHNLDIAFTWATLRETPKMIEFEKEVNKNL